ncbi:MAG: rhodanese-like domain-containing protein [Rhodoferax sp.]
MTFILDNWILILIALTSGALLMLPALKSAGGDGLTPEAAVQLINREKAVVIDVCEPNEYAVGHVAGARNVPLGQLQSRLGAEVKNKALPLILVCQSGARSARARAIARDLGYQNVHSLSGGLSAWRSAQLPVEKA